MNYTARVDREGRQISNEEWSALFDDEDYPRVAKAVSADGTLEVSTVWIGVVPDSIFESMVFDGENSVDYERYNTEEQALDGHGRLVNKYITRPMLESALRAAGGHSTLLDGAL